MQITKRTTACQISRYILHKYGKVENQALAWIYCSFNEANEEYGHEAKGEVILDLIKLWQEWEAGYQQGRAPVRVGCGGDLQYV